MRETLTVITGKVKSNISFGNIDLDLTKELEEIAKRDIIPDIHKKIDASVDIENKAYRSLSPKTVAIKRRRGHRLEPLIATGQLRRSIRHRVLSRNKIVISFQGMRKPYGKEQVISNIELAEILQLKGVNTSYGKRYFKFFGISDEAERQAYRRMVKFIKKAVRDARSRTI